MPSKFKRVRHGRVVTVLFLTFTIIHFALAFAGFLGENQRMWAVPVTVVLLLVGVGRAVQQDWSVQWPSISGPRGDAAGPGSMSERHQDYLSDLGFQIRERATEARRPESPKGDSADLAFAAGRRTAYYEALSLMTQQAAVFGLPLSDLNLADLDLERDIL